MAVEPWKPQEAQLRQLIGLLNDSLSPRDKTAQKNAELMIKQAKASLEIDNYLCFLLTERVTVADAAITTEILHNARCAAGVMLKNDLKTNFASIPQASKDYIRANIFKGLRDSNVQIRNFAGNVITEYCRLVSVTGWTDALPSLLAIASNESGNESPEAQQGAVSALRKVCEDNMASLSLVSASQGPLDFLAPRLIQLTSSPIVRVRADAVACLILLLEEKVDSLMDDLDSFIQRVFDLATDSSDEIKRRICTAITSLAKIAPAKIAPHMDSLVSYVLVQQQSADDSELALEAADFWLTIAESRALRDTVAPFLQSIVPVLLQCMVYGEDDVIRLESEAEDANAEDKEQDIKPHFAASKALRGTNAAAAGGSKLSNGTDTGTPRTDGDSLSDGELEPYDPEDVDDNPEDQWNLRKCSAAALDVFANAFNQPVFDATLPYLKTNLTHRDWPNREAAVLAIGAIAEGCMDVVKPHLPDLVPFLITLLSDDEPVVRKITCWSLARYSGWAASLDEAGRAQFFVPMMDGMLKRMLDSDKRVQEAAASAFATLEEKSGRVLEDPRYCQVIAGQFAACFEKYKDRNMFILYDCVQTLAEHVGPTMQTPELVNTLMPALIKRWEKIGDQSQEMFPLLECLSYIATALAHAFSPFAAPIFGRCIKIIYQTLQDSQRAIENPALDVPNEDFLVTSLDLLSAVLQSLDGRDSLALVQTSQPSMFDLLVLCMQYRNYSVRQSAYALLGDSAVYVFTELQPFVPRIIPILLKELEIANSPEDEEFDYPVPNNACWSCGEISARAGRDMTPFAELLQSLFYGILCNDDLPPSLHENAAIALGRLGLACPETMGPQLGTLAPVFTRAMSSIAWTDEKAQAMTGMSQVILANPAGLQTCLLQFVTEISMAPVWVVSDVTGEAFQRVLDLYTPHATEFANLLQHLPLVNQENLRQSYRL